MMTLFRKYCGFQLCSIGTCRGRAAISHYAFCHSHRPYSLDERVYPVAHNGVEEMMTMTYPDPKTPKLDPPDDEPPSLNKASTELLGRASVPGPEDPLAHLATKKTSPRRGGAQVAGPLSPDDEQLSANLISLGTPEDQPDPTYDPFAEKNMGSVDFPQNEFRGNVAPLSSHQHGGEQQQEERLSRHYRPPPSVRALDPLYSTESSKSPPTHHDQSDYGGEEKKVGIEEQNEMMETQQQQQQPQYHLFQYDMDSGLKSGEEDFIPIQREGYRLGGIAGHSPNSVSTEQSHQSAALRGAQEFLRKNRRRRQEQA